MFLEIKKFHSLPSVSWRSRKDSGVFSEPENLKSWWCKFWSESMSPRVRSSDVWGQEKMALSSSRECKFAVPPSFCSIQALSRWMMPSTWWGWSPLFNWQNWKWVLIAQSCPALRSPTDCSPPGSSVHGILQARTLEWIAMPSSRGSSRPRDQIWVSCTEDWFFTIWAIREVTQLTYSKAKPCAETPSQIDPEIMFHLLSEHPLAQLHKINTSHTFNSFCDPGSLLDLHFLIC